MTNNELLVLIEQLEVAVMDADETIKEAFESSKYMVEPVKTQFIKELTVKQVTLNERKELLNYYKKVLGE